MQLPKQLDSKDGAMIYTPASDIADGSELTESRDPTIRLLLDRLVQENTPSTPAEFGPYIADGVPKRRAVRTSLLAREKSALPRPDGTLIGHLAEHSGAVTGIVSSPDNVFFVSASEDGTLRVWDSVRLERNVTSRSRQTIHLNHPVTALCRLEHTHCVAAATKSGSISVHRINVRLDGALPKHEKPEAIRQYQFTRPGEHATAIAHYQQGGWITTHSPFELTLSPSS